MAFESRSFSATRIHTFLLSFLCIFLAVHGTETDIHCLRSIKESLEDPNDYLSWDFKNISEGVICAFRGVQCWSSDNRVMNLKMSNLGLKGQFPRGIQNCSSLVSLDLSGNELSGPLPSDISKLVSFISLLDLSNNKFSGEIPASLANCFYLNTLILDHNRLSGQIPQAIGLLNRLMTFSVSNNYLSGPVPSFRSFRDDLFPSDRYANNTGLCGGPLAPCEPVISNISFYKSFKDGAIIGYSFSVTSVVIIYLSYCVPWAQIVKKKRRKKMNQKKANKICEPVALKLLEKQRQEISKLERFSSRMSFMELYNATECFSMDNDIGRGKMGMMYKARLRNGLLLAVKRLHDPNLFKSQFVREIAILGRYRHRNMVPLLGFCIEGEERILAYQYISNGSLSDWLKPSESTTMRLEWPMRVKIAIGIARGLSWLHHNLHIVHLRLCCWCILLDQNFNPKISNFGDAKFVSPKVAGDLCVSLEVNNCSDELGLEKKDVHDFGRVVFELITGKPCEQMTRYSNGTNGSGNLLGFYDAIDKSMIGTGIEDEIFILLKIAVDCIVHIPDQRPTMHEVYDKMVAIGERYGLIEGSQLDMSNHSEIDSATSEDEIVEI